MKRAYIAIREAPVYRREAFLDGLRAYGFEDIRFGTPDRYDPDTLFICWNRYHENHVACERLQNSGGIALVAENGYVAPGGASPHGMNPRTWFAFAPNFHNDQTTIQEGDASRWNALNVALRPWREDGAHILVCPNRSFGTPGRIMPVGWPQDVAKRLKKLTSREIRIRPHPGNNAPEKPLAEDLAGAWATVIWSSSAGVHSLIAGIPVVCEAPAWICKSVTYIDPVAVLAEKPAGDRESAMRRLAWAQWSIDEIRSGAPLGHLLRRNAQAEVRAAD